MDVDAVRKWLDERWRLALADRDGEIDPATDRFVNSRVVSIRFAIVTQLLGKVAEPSRDLLCLQKGVASSDADSVSGRWDPRSFCVKVVVPWNRKNEGVLGASGDPYVNNPLRRPRLDDGWVNIRTGDRADWKALASHLRELQGGKDPSTVRNAFQACLLSVARRLAQSRFEYPVPNRVSVEQLCGVLDEFLEASSGGLRPQVVATALMRVLGEAFSVFTRVDGQGVNEADSARSVPGDILCYGPSDEAGGPEKIRLAVEVKSAHLRLTELQGSVAKARQSKVENVLFAAPGFGLGDRHTMERIVADEFVQGLNVFVMPITGLVRSAFVLLDENPRTALLSPSTSHDDAERSGRSTGAWILAGLPEAPSASRRCGVFSEECRRRCRESDDSTARPGPERTRWRAGPGSAGVGLRRRRPSRSRRGSRAGRRRSPA